MAEYVKVVNNSSKPYEEDFKGKKISIPGKGFITMERHEAVNFLGTVGNSFTKEKNLDIVRGEQKVVEEVKKPVFISHIDGKTFDTQEELDTYLKSLVPEEKGVEPVEDEDVDTAKKRRQMLKG